MQVALYMSSKERERVLGVALADGFNKHGISAELRLRSNFWSDREDGKLAAADVIGFVGVKSRKMWNVCAELGKIPLLLDKSYFSRGDYHRISIGSYQPAYLDAMSYSPTRLNSMGVRLRDRRIGGDLVVFAGSSNKFHLFHQLEHVDTYAHNTCSALAALDYSRAISKPRLIYRPKPSWWANDDDGPKTVPTCATLSPPSESLSTLLQRCHCLVTFGSNAAVEALAAGVPIVILSEAGISPVRSLGGTRLEDVVEPFWPTEADRGRVLANLAWCQFSTREIAAGFAWDHIRSAWKGDVCWNPSP